MRKNNPPERPQANHSPTPHHHSTPVSRAGGTPPKPRPQPPRSGAANGHDPFAPRPSGHPRSQSQRASTNPHMTTRVDSKGRPQSPKRKKRLTRKQRTLRIVLAVVGSILVLALGVYAAWRILFLDRINIQPVDSEATMMGPSGVMKIPTASTKDALVVEDTIHNILLIGQDSTDSAYSKDGSGSRSDIMMILTINDTDGTLKLSSIQRDCLAYIPGYPDPRKINAAMSFGGPQLLIRTIEDQLRIDLEQYAYVDISHMEKVIDAVGGITINVTESERTADHGVNDLIAQQNVMNGEAPSANKLYDSGLVNLTGRQAVAYARVRYVGDGDYGRSKRQVTVLTALMEQYMTLGLTQKVTVAGDILSLISTNVSKQEIENYAFNFLPKIKDASIEYLQIPLPGYYYEDNSGDWSIRTNWNGMIPVVQEFIFGKTHPFDPVKTIPDAPIITPTPTPKPTVTPAT